jgi:hypothetical protein
MSRLAFINGLLGVILVVLGLGIWSTWARTLPPEPVITRTAPAGKPATESHGGGKGKRASDKNAAAAPLAPAALVTAIVERDLFDPSRQKAAEEAAKVQAVAKETGPPPGVNVVGLRILGRDREAFVTDQAQGNQQRRLRVGDQVGGYTVQQITASGLTLTSPSGDPVTMALNIEKGGKGGAQPTAPRVQPATPPRPGQPVAASTSPAAGIQAPSPAAGIGAKPATPGQAVPPRAPTAPMVPPPVPGQPLPPGSAAALAAGQQLPPEVRDKLEKLKEHQGSRLGRKR